MRLPFSIPDHDRRLIPDGRLAGIMPWIIAIMLFLTALSAATAIRLGYSVQANSSGLARQATVQLLEPDPAARATDQKRIAAWLERFPGVSAVRAVPESEARQLLEPWIGSAVEDAGIPVPALIDIAFASPPDNAQLRALRIQLVRQTSNARVDTHSSWIAPLLSFLRTILWIALSVLLLLLVATAATVALSVRAALNTHRSTIEIMHMMGSTDLQVARLFQRRIAVDSLFGGGLGLSAAILVLVLVGQRFSALGSGLLAGESFPIIGWLLLALIPLAVTGLAMLMARWTVLSALKRML